MNEHPAQTPPTDASAELVFRNWWLLALRGVAAILFGVLALVWPKLWFLQLLFLAGAYTIANGILSFVAAANTPRDNPRFGSLVAFGIFSLIVGAIAFGWPGLVALVLLVWVALWAIVGGIVEIASALRARRVISNERRWLAAGIASVVFGIILLIWPTEVIFGLIMWIGVCAIIAGAIMLNLAYRLRKRAGVAISAARPVAP